MPEKVATIYDVADKAEISIATVSRVINNPEKVSSKTKDKVFEVMELLHFVPKADARARAKRNTGRIGIITFNLTYPSFAHRLRGISQALEGTPFEMVIITIKDKKDINYYLKSINLTDKLDGIIVLSHKLNPSSLILINDLQIKTIFIEFGEDNFSSVSINNTKGGTLVADYLLDKGYKSFSILTEYENEKYVLPNHMRVSGFITQLKNRNINVDPGIINYGSDNINESVLAAEKILSKKKRPEVIFATTDLLAVAVIKAAKKLKISIPDELGVIGFDGTNISDYLDITTVDQSLEESGIIAVELLIKAIKNPEYPVQTVILPLTIIERDTIK